MAAGVGQTAAWRQGPTVSWPITVPGRRRRSVQPEPIVHHGERDLSDGLAVGKGPRPDHGQGITDTAVAVG